MAQQSNAIEGVWYNSKKERQALTPTIRLVVCLVVVALVAASIYGLLSVLRMHAESDIARGVDASSARWVELGRHLTAESLPREADSDRWVLRGAPYDWGALGRQARAEAERLQRSVRASSARWTAIGAYYLARYERAAAASSARWAALGEHYRARYERAAAASSARYKALAKYYAQKEAAQGK